MARVYGKWYAGLTKCIRCTNSTEMSPTDFAKPDFSSDRCKNRHHYEPPCSCKLSQSEYDQCELYGGAQSSGGVSSTRLPSCPAPIEQVGTFGDYEEIPCLPWWSIMLISLGSLGGLHFLGVLFCCDNETYWRLLGTIDGIILSLVALPAVPLATLVPWRTLGVFHELLFSEISGFGPPMMQLAAKIFKMGWLQLAHTLADIFGLIFCVVFVVLSLPFTIIAALGEAIAGMYDPEDMPLFSDMDSKMGSADSADNAEFYSKMKAGLLLTMSDFFGKNRAARGY